MSAAALSDEARLAWLRIARTPSIGPIGFARLLKRHPDPQDALAALPELAAKGGGKPPASPGRDQIEAELEQADRYGARLILSCEAEFPALLSALGPPPPVITVKGELPAPDKPACAMVGARNASAAGLRFARELASGLGGHGVTIVSGLARGVDGAAHQGALETGTIAVVAGGVDHIYPPEHARLHDAIAERGAVISERAMGRIPTAKDFPRRNRLISGLSLGVLVVEAALKSGSLITARFAAEQGREVMAVPGSPIDPRAAGANRLIRDGAALIESVEDVLDILHGARPAAMREADRDAFEAVDYEMEDAPLPVDLNDRLAALLSPAPVSIDELARQAAAPVGAARAAVLELEFAGRARQLPGGLVQAAGESLASA